MAADTLVVSALRADRPFLEVPFAMYVRAITDLPRAEPGMSLGEKLRYVPGLVVDNRQNMSQGDRITMRGIGARAAFGVRGIRLVLDGIPLTMPDGQAQLSNLDLVDIARVEVLRGPSAALYGNASGGVILLQSGAGKQGTFSIRPSVVMGGNGLRRVQVQTSGQTGNHTYAASGYQMVATGYRDFSSGRTWALNAHNTYRISDRWQVSGAIHHVDSPFLLNPSSLDRATADSLPKTARFFVRSQGSSKSVLQAQGGVTARFSGQGVRVETTLYGLRRALYNPIPGRVVDVDRQAGGWRSAISWHRAPISWTAGLDVEAQRDSRQEFANEGLPPGEAFEASEVLGRVRRGPPLLDQKESVTSLGPFVHVGWAVTKRWLVAAGARCDHFSFDVQDRLFAAGKDASGSRAMDKWSPSVGLTFRVTDLISVYANAGTAFQTPTTTELGNRPDGAGGFNPDLDPERMASIEAGVKGFTSSGSLAFDAAAYQIRIRDMLIPFQVSGSEEIFYRNAGRARNLGFETHLRWTPAAAVRVDGSFSRQRFTFQDYRIASGEQLSGNRVPGVPPYRISIGFALNHRSGAFCEVHLQATADVFANDLNGPTVGSSKAQGDFVNEGAVVTDWRMGLDHSFFKGYLGINNVFGRRYNGSIVPNAAGDRFFEPAAGRTLFAGVAIEME